jgi:phenylalanyl-tRNA synthetase alpha subunit
LLIFHLFENTKLILILIQNAYQANILKEGYKKYLVIGDVYRLNQIDTIHYSIFHQGNLVMIFFCKQCLSLNGKYQVVYTRTNENQ